MFPATVANLFRQLETPLLRNIELQWEEWNVEVWPERLPDLYAGQPLVISGRTRRIGGGVTVRGQRRDRPWEVTLPIADDAEATGIDKLWARRKIAALMDHQYRGGNPQETRQAVVEVALRHHLLSSYTSLVAVDRTPAGSRPPEQPLAERPVPTNLAHGCSFEQIFGCLPQTATPARLYLLLGLAVVGGALLLGWLGRGRAA